MAVLKIESEHLALQALYHLALPHRCKQIGGRWMGNAHGWSFSLHEEQAIRDICLDIWSVDSTPSTLENKVDLKVTVAEEGSQRAEARQGKATRGLQLLNDCGHDVSRSAVSRDSGQIGRLLDDGGKKSFRQRLCSFR
jgi:hypothetical protein